MYATALNEVVEEYGIKAKTDGEKIIKRMWNRTINGMLSYFLDELSWVSMIQFLINSIQMNYTFFHFLLGVTGNVTIDDNGDRNADYSLLDMDPSTGNFKVIWW